MWEAAGDVSLLFKTRPGRGSGRALHPEYLEEPNQQVGTITHAYIIETVLCDCMWPF